RSVCPSALKSLKRFPGAGARGLTTARGVTAMDQAENAPVPAAPVAATWNLTAVPLSSPVTFKVVVPAAADRSAPIWTLAALATRTEYPVIADVAALPGGVHETRAEMSPATAVTPVGATAVVGGGEGANCSRSMFRRVSVPLAPPLLCTTVVLLPGAPRVAPAGRVVTV